MSWFKVPVRFQLFGQTINVEPCETLLTDEQAAAKVYPDKNIIKIQPASKAWHISEARLQHNFCHEFLHLLFITAGYEEDYADEFKVELMAGLLHQALTTMEFKK